MEENIQAASSDNLNSTASSETSTASSLLGAAEVESNVSEIKVPDKFLVDGQPDYQKLTKSYIELEKHIGAKAPVTDPAEYDFQFQNPDQWDAQGLEEFKKFAVEKGYSKEQFNDALALYEQNVSKMLENIVETPQKATATLKEKWGNDFDGNLKDAFKAFNTFAPEGFDIHSIGNNVPALELLAHIGKQLKEDNIPSTTSSSPTKMSKLEVEELMRSSDYLENREKQRIVTEWYNSVYG
ncbi:hypothetical protein [Methylomonas koyamae]|uniref:hypothetical protein n=1 Tax=Methylomonas koyamae TaxID=702114 RepID=UPI0006D0D7E9|nr:hypothetical protein [Methylomonas koyamae]BBL56997.1 hypothetical protein MKFW12EY_06100 [Methylomonas koyamae]